MGIENWMRSGSNDPKRSPEAAVSYSESRMPFAELVERTRRQAHEAIKNARLVAVLREGGFVNEMTAAPNDDAQIVIAQDIIEKYSRLIPDHIEDTKEQHAFVVAMCEELSVEPTDRPG